MGKGQHRALQTFVRWARGHRYTMVLDVHRFFPSIDHEVLEEVIFRQVREPETRALIAHVIEASNPQPPVPMHFAGDDLFEPLARRRGLPPHRTSTRVRAPRPLLRRTRQSSGLVGPCSPRNDKPAPRRRLLAPDVSPVYVLGIGVRTDTQRPNTLSYDRSTSQCIRGLFLLMTQTDHRQTRR